MADQLTFAQENRERIQAVENSFGPLSKSLSQLNRVLIGEGRLIKQSRRGPQRKDFFLFNDVLVYGSIILHGRWHKKQKIIPLEDIQLQDLEDGLRMRNQWLIRTPRKSFYVAAESYEEKQAWIEHIEDCQNRLLQSGGRIPTSKFAITWIPDQASAICMRCSDRFTMTIRRHHCRKCGFVVCDACSKKRAVIKHIHPTKRLRVCDICQPNILKMEAEAQEINRLRGDSTGKSGSEEDDLEEFSEEDTEEDQVEDHDTSRWMNCEMGSRSTYVYLKPEHVRH
ncbi:pleckstrin homology domain-containing family F member 1 [Scomber scombrus]|uniref:Pleckstrin homology domain-containing family F member 1 n=1 Tax=Scomber scombrus TaxID=13677 RepID=A0AAV1PFH9_SCOSC